ncbi:hypothetical protein ACOMHN_060565 [Nucella lapillus]
MEEGHRQSENQMHRTAGERQERNEKKQTVSAEGSALWTEQLERDRNRTRRTRQCQQREALCGQNSWRETGTEREEADSVSPRQNWLDRTAGMRHEQNESGRVETAQQLTISTPECSPHRSNHGPRCTRGSRVYRFMQTPFSPTMARVDPSQLGNEKPSKHDCSFH